MQMGTGLSVLDIIPTLFVQWHRDCVIEMLLFSVCIGVVIKIEVNHPITWDVYAEYETACGCIIFGICLQIQQ